MNKDLNLPRFHGIESLRAMAIIMVVLYHYTRWFEHPAWFPAVFLFFWSGVDLFFVISGFLISAQLFNQIKVEGGFSLKEFYFKRFFRIVPMYYFVLAIYFLFPFFSHDFGTSQALPPLWRFLTFTQNLGADYAHHRSFVSAWSLCVEEHFYFFFPLLMLLFLKLGWFSKSYILFPVLLFFGVGIRLYLWQVISPLKASHPDFNSLYAQTIYLPTYCRLDGLLMGVCIAAIYVFLNNFFVNISKYGNYFILAGILIFMIAGSQYSVEYNVIETVFGFPVVSFGFALVLLGAIMPASFLYAWKSTVLAKIGEWSYTLYLIHMIAILSTQRLFSDFGIAKNSFLMFLIAISVCLLFTVILHYTLEKPLMKWRSAFLKTRNS